MGCVKLLTIDDPRKGKRGDEPCCHGLMCLTIECNSRRDRVRQGSLDCTSVDGCTERARALLTMSLLRLQSKLMSIGHISYYYQTSDHIIIMLVKLSVT